MNQGRTTISQRIEKWYEGEFIPPDNKPGDLVVRVMGHYERPPLARLIARAIAFYLTHWKWLITTVIALAAVAIVIMAE